MTTRHTLVVLRHAKSDWSTGLDDRRPPAGRPGPPPGVRGGTMAGGARPGPGRRIVSPAVRARSTWELVAAELPGTSSAHVVDRVYDASPDDLLSVLAELPETARTGLLVGHNPGLEDLVEHLVGEPVRLAPRPWPWSTYAGRGRGSVAAPRQAPDEWPPAGPCPAWPLGACPHPGGGASSEHGTDRGLATQLADAARAMQGLASTQETLDKVVPVATD